MCKQSSAAKDRLPKNQFGLRRLFVLMTVSAFLFAVTAWIVQWPVLRFMLFFYLPPFVVYFLIRGPFLYFRWRRLRRAYADVGQTRQAIIDQARGKSGKPSQDEGPTND